MNKPGIASCGLAAMIVFMCGLVALSCSDDNKGTDPGNRPPAISSMTATPDTILEGNVTTIAVAASDPDGHTLSYEWESRASWLTAVSIVGGSAEMVNCCPISGFASSYVIVTVSDGHGAEVSDSVEVWVMPQ